MLTTTELVLYSVCLAILLPLVVHSFLTGSKPPQQGPLSKYYQAERHLITVGNLFLLTLCGVALGKLGLHFGHIDSSLADEVDFWSHLPFFIMFFIFVAFFVRAVLKVRRGSRAA